MKIWNSYISLVKSTCSSPVEEIKDLTYWRNNLFAGTIIYLLPFCLIALLPSLYYILITGQYVLAVVDVVTVTSMVMLAFLPGIAVYIRKIIFIACIYVFSCIMLYYVGPLGPGLIFLQSACIFSILIFDSRYAYWPAFLSLLISVLFAVAIFFHALPWPNDQHHSIGSWIAISSNLIFLNFLSSALIPRLFDGLQETIEKEKKLHDQLGQKQQSLEHAMEMLEQKNSELEQFAYVASHDLQEPLRMIATFLSMLEKKYNDVIDERGKKYINLAVDGAQRMRQIILDLLEFSRVGKTEDRLETVNLNELVSEILSIYSQQIQEKNISISVRDLPTLKAYRSLMRQVFQNLISNAVKYHSEKEGVVPQIKISSQATSSHWIFTVSDNGIGISPQHFDRIFIIFQRLHNVEDYPGTGIGLAIIKKIIENIGGKIWVESEPGMGTKFFFTIPKQVKPVN